MEPEMSEVYTTAQAPNLHWSYRGDDEVVLWAAENILSGGELTVDFSASPQPLEMASKPPATWQPPPQKSESPALSEEA
eukprot:s560_g2.t1